MYIGHDHTHSIMVTVVQPSRTAGLLILPGHFQAFCAIFYCNYELKNITVYGVPLPPPPSLKFRL